MVVGDFLVDENTICKSSSRPSKDIIKRPDNTPMHSAYIANVAQVVDRES